MVILALFFPLIIRRGFLARSCENLGLEEFRAMSSVLLKFKVEESVVFFNSARIGFLDIFIHERVMFN